ncbi:C-Jun-amino-terminal kinase-interacting protein 3-like [Crotalus adamanteus]|uniref:C-Jun-amino-terminal kinase-interacting protein 3-like n=1 Tax=Crotalus adamanteus TaxID=8729 RepID=A0AAW1B1C6_CROAD
MERNTSELLRQGCPFPPQAERGLSQTQRFTHAEMARVVMERNLYKERLMELQEVVQRAELLSSGVPQQLLGRSLEKHHRLIPPHCSSSGSSQLWVAAGTHSASEVTLFSAPNTNQLLEHFVLPGIHILFMACVPGLTALVGEKPLVGPEILEDPLAPRSDSDEEAREMEAVGREPTLWIGTQEGWHTQGRVVAALADGSLAIFHRNTVTSHPESHVQHMAAAGGGIWVSVHLETTLCLLHAETGQPLQEVELEPFISRMFGPSSVSLALNISALGAFGKWLWVGTSGGTIISVPFVSESSESLKTSPSSGIPYCAMEQAQISYHGHRDAVHFFVSVPKNLKDSHSQEKLSKPCSLVLSGGEGYINLRIGDNSNKHYGDLLHLNLRLCQAERSHLIVWQVQD